jgi:15-cis-phytoene synthase
VEHEHDLDALVRRVDPDRWLAARFIEDHGKREDVIVLYAFHHELARAVEVTSQPLLGEIRLTWWREAVDEIYRGKTIRRHPTVEALALAVERQGWPEPEVEALIEGRSDALDAGPPLQAEAVYAALDGTAGALMLLAARTLDPSTPLDAVRGAARAWGLSGLARTQAAGGKRLLPPGFNAPAEVRSALRDARLEGKLLPVEAFPAVAYATLARAYVDGRAIGPVEKQLRLLWAVTRGRV